MQSLYIFLFSQFGLLEFTSIDSKEPAIHEEVHDSISRDLYKLPHNNIYNFCRPIFITYLNYLAPEKMASLRQSPLQFYPNRRHCCSSGTVYQEGAPIGSRALPSNQASFVNAPPIGPAAFTSSSINSVTAIAHQPSKFSTVCLANWLTRIRRRLWAVVFGIICGPRKLS